MMWSVAMAAAGSVAMVAAEEVMAAEVKEEGRGRGQVVILLLTK